MSHETARREILEESTVPVVQIDNPLSGRELGHPVDLHQVLGYGANPPHISFVELPWKTGVGIVPVLPDIHAPITDEVRRQQLAAVQAAAAKNWNGNLATGAFNGITFGDFNHEFTRGPASGEPATPVTEDLVLNHGQRRAKIDALLASLHVDNSGPMTESNGPPEADGTINKHYHQPSDRLPPMFADGQSLFAQNVYARARILAELRARTTPPSTAPTPDDTTNGLVGAVLNEPVRQFSDHAPITIDVPTDIRPKMS